MSRRLLLRLLFAAPPTDHVSDAELLRRFVGSNDSAAFELIVRRHADAVWAACRRVLRSDSDAEDAFQATFLALLRKARDIRTPCAGGWLHRVAVNAALKLRERNKRTSTAEPNQLDAIPAPNTEPPDGELASAVHEELARLSEHERLPVVLCDLEGLSHADAATALGWPVGTVSGRLSRARAKLRARLARRGLTPSGAGLPALAVPPHLIPNALSLTAGAPPAVVSLAEGVLSAMRTAKLKLTAVVLAATGLVALAGLGTAFALAPKPAPIAPVPNQPPAEAASAEDDPPEPDNKPKIDRKWQDRPFPSAFPEIEPLSTKALDEFKKKHVEPIYESDPPLRKLQKARLQVALNRLRYSLEYAEKVEPPAKDNIRPPIDIFPYLARLSKESQEAAALALEVYPTRDGRRAWLVLRVATEKLVELDGTKSHWLADSDVPRLDAEIELAKFDKQK